MKKLVKVVSSLAVVVSLAGMSAQVASAATEVTPLASAEEVVTNPAIKKGQQIIVKDTKKQSVAVYNNNGQKTNKSVKQGSEFTAKAVKKINGKKLVKIASNQWLNATDVAEN